MTAVSRLIYRLGCIALAACAFSSCSTTSKGPGGAITKVNPYHLQPLERPRGVDPSVSFERTYRLYGAVSLAEQLERAGHYYTIHWKVDDRTQPVTVKFEYRQKNTGLTVKVKEIQADTIKRHNTTEFTVTGSDYRSEGPVTAWRVSLMRGKELLASSESFLWN
jgi:hypothetical protein